LYTLDPRFKNVATAHADTMLADNIRPDGSVVHVMAYDPASGQKLGPEVGQGYSKQSSWARGTGWAIYGYALSGMYTNNPRYIEAAEKVADFMMANLPPDGVPRADLLAPPEDSDCVMDSSAAAIAAGGMLLLEKLTKNPRRREDALKLLEALQSTCVAGVDEEALLLHGNVGYHRPLSKDIPLIYGDFFYLEALCMLEGSDTLF